VEATRQLPPVRVNFRQSLSNSATTYGVEDLRFNPSTLAPADLDVVRTEFGNAWREWRCAVPGSTNDGGPNAGAA
jgi:hypothetical protein